VIKTYFGHHLERVKPVLPVVLSIVLVIAIVAALNADNLMNDCDIGNRHRGSFA